MDGTSGRARPEDWLLAGFAILSPDISGQFRNSLRGMHVALHRPGQRQAIFLTPILTTKDAKLRGACELRDAGFPWRFLTSDARASLSKSLLSLSVVEENVNQFVDNSQIEFAIRTIGPSSDEVEGLA
jgi:hypothetical protein